MTHPTRYRPVGGASASLDTPNALNSCSPAVRENSVARYTNDAKLRFRNPKMLRIGKDGAVPRRLGTRLLDCIPPLIRQRRIKNGHPKRSAHPAQTFPLCPPASGGILSRGLEGIWDFQSKSFWTMRNRYCIDIIGSFFDSTILEKEKKSWQIRSE